MKFKNLYLVFMLAMSFLICISYADGSFLNKKSINEFEIDSLLLKIVINEKGAVENTIKIRNLVSEKLHISLKMNNLENLASLNKNEFYLNESEEKKIKINFDAKNADLGVYLGNLEISSDNENRKIPVILEIQSKDVLFDSNINLYPKGDVVSGERINAEIKIFDLAGIGRSKVRINYLIKDFEGRTGFSESEDLVIENNLDYSKTLGVSKDLKIGNYVFITTTQYKNSIGTSSLFFSIVEGKNELASGKFMIWMILFVIFLFFLFSFIFIYLLFYRDKALLELKSQYEMEIKRQKRIIRQKEKRDYSKLKTRAEKKEYKKQIKKLRKSRINALKRIHRKRTREYNRIKKSGNRERLKRQIKEWKSKGYDTGILEKKFKLPDVNEIKRKIKEWKSKGYETSVLVKTQKTKFK